MEPDTVTTPKINKTTFKLGSGNLLSQVAKNTEKITLLRRIVTRQDTKISEGITPKIDSMQESMLQTNAILTDVASQLEKDFSSRLKEQRELLERERKDSDKLKRDLKEERLESKKSSKFARKLSKINYFRCVVGICNSNNLAPCIMKIHRTKNNYI